MKPVYLLDTNVLAELQKSEAEADPRVWSFLADNEWLIPAPVLAEVQDGISRMGSASERAQLQAKFDEILFAFSACLVGFTPEDALTWGRQQHSPAVKKQPQSAWDSFLDAMTCRRDTVIATRNTKDFRNCRTVNPWKPLENPSA